MKWYRKKPISIFIKYASETTSVPLEDCELIIDSFFKTIIENITTIHVFKLPHLGKITTIRFKNKKRINFSKKANDEKLKKELEDIDLDFFDGL